MIITYQYLSILITIPCQDVSSAESALLSPSKKHLQPSPFHQELLPCKGVVVRGGASHAIVGKPTWSDAGAASAAV
jgi:hypothetical protein